jgi:hypothetical protein
LSKHYKENNEFFFICLPRKLILGVPATTFRTVAAGAAGVGTAVVGVVVAVVVVAAAGVVVTAAAEVVGVAAAVPVAPGVFE